MRSHRDAPAIRMPVSLMRSSLPDKVKSIALKCGNEFLCGERSEAYGESIRNFLDGDGDPRLFL